MARSPKRALGQTTVTPVAGGRTTFVAPSTALDRSGDDNTLGRDLAALSATLAQEASKKTTAINQQMEEAAVAIGQRVAKGEDLAKVIAEFTESKDTPRQLAARLRKLQVSDGIEGIDNPFFGRALETTVAGARGRDAVVKSEGSVPLMVAAAREALQKGGDGDAARAAADSAQADFFRTEFGGMFEGLGDFGSTMLQEQINGAMHDRRIVAMRQVEVEVHADMARDNTEAVMLDVRNAVDIANNPDVEDFDAETHFGKGVRAKMEDAWGLLQAGAHPDPTGAVRNMVIQASAEIKLMQDPAERVDAFRALANTYSTLRTPSEDRIFKGADPKNAEVLNTLTRGISLAERDVQNSQSTSVDATKYFNTLLSRPYIDKNRSQLDEADLDMIESDILNAKPEEQSKVRTLILGRFDERDRIMRSRKDEGAVKAEVEKLYQVVNSTLWNAKTSMQLADEGTTVDDIVKGVPDESRQQVRFMVNARITKNDRLHEQRRLEDDRAEKKAKVPSQEEEMNLAQASTNPTLMLQTRNDMRDIPQSEVANHLITELGVAEADAPEVAAAINKNYERTLSDVDQARANLKGIIERRVKNRPLANTAEGALGDDGDFQLQRAHNIDEVSGHMSDWSQGAIWDQVLSGNMTMPEAREAVTIEIDRYIASRNFEGVAAATVTKETVTRAQTIARSAEQAKARKRISFYGGSLSAGDIKRPPFTAFGPDIQPSGPSHRVGIPAQVSSNSTFAITSEAKAERSLYNARGRNKFTGDWLRASWNVESFPEEAQITDADIANSAEITADYVSAALLTAKITNGDLLSKGGDIITDKDMLAVAEVYLGGQKVKDSLQVKPSDLDLEAMKIRLVETQAIFTLDARDNLVIDIAEVPISQLGNRTPLTDKERSVLVGEKPPGISRAMFRAQYKGAVEQQLGNYEETYFNIGEFSKLKDFDEVLLRQNAARYPHTVGRAFEDAKKAYITIEGRPMNDKAFTDVDQRVIFGEYLHFFMDDSRRRGRQ